MVESAHAEVEDKERSELEMKVEMELMREELERLRCSEDTLQNRLDLQCADLTATTRTSKTQCFCQLIHIEGMGGGWGMGEAAIFAERALSTRENAL